MGVIVGFNRRRDSYQLPIAFAETGELDAFVTDYYYGRSALRLGRLRHRRDEAIPTSVVRTAPAAWLRQMTWEVRRKVDGNAMFPSAEVDSAIGRRTASVLREFPASDLVMYSGYALEPFRHGRGKRILFQFHPTRRIIREAIDGDELRDLRPWLQERELRADYRGDERSSAEIAVSTGFLSASTLTKRGLELDGVAPDRVAVVPYGCDPPADPPRPPVAGRIRFLYVGQGVQRKGLHLLLAAWRAARLRNSELTCICLRIDPEIAAMVEGMAGVTLKSAVSWPELQQEYAEADTLVVPSLLEGFGLVLLEALSRGCRLIGSTNTGLVDLDLPATIATTVQAGAVDPLRQALERHADTFEPARPYAEEAWRAAGEWSWQRFRRGVRDAVHAS